MAAAKAVVGPPRYFGIGIDTLMPPGSRNLPRILIFLCEYLCERVMLVAESERSVHAELLDMVHDSLDPDMFRAVKARFAAGDFYDCRSAVCMFRLLKAFVRELSDPLLPASQYDGATGIAERHMQVAVYDMTSCERYPSFLLGFDEQPGGDLDQWIRGLWTTHLGDRMLHGRAGACAKALVVVGDIAFAANRTSSDLEELFFNLPRPNRDCLEYLGVTLVKLDLKSRQQEQEAQSNGQATPTTATTSVLEELSASFAPHAIRPSAWTTGNRQEKGRRKSLQQVFFRCFLLFVKRKHNLMTAAERRVMDDGVREVAERAVVAQCAPSVRLHLAIEDAPGLSGLDHDLEPTPAMLGRRPSSDARARNRSASAKSSVELDNGNGIGEGPGGQSPQVRRKAGRVTEVVVLASRGSSGSTASKGTAAKAGYSVAHTMSAEDADIEAELLAECPNLEAWLAEPAVLFSSALSKSTGSSFVCEPPDDSVGFANHNSPSGTVEASEPPGQGILYLLGPQFCTAERLHELPANVTHENIFACPPSTRAINYDYAMAFPRSLVCPNCSTHADWPAVVDRVDAVDKFLSFPSQVKKAVYAADLRDDLLNHRRAKLRAEENPIEHCEACRIPLPRLFSFARAVKRTHCRYCGMVLCGPCCSKSFVIPSYVLGSANCELHSVCAPCHRHLELHKYKPLLELEQMSETAIKAFGRDKIHTLMRYRRRALWDIYLRMLPDCPSRHAMVSLIPSTAMHLLMIFPRGIGPRLSLVELCELQAWKPLAALKKYVGVLDNHVHSCPTCSKQTYACSANELCQFAGRHEVIAAVMGEVEVIMCRACKGYCHQTCWDRVQDVCLACREHQDPTLSTSQDSAEDTLSLDEGYF